MPLSDPDGLLYNHLDHILPDLKVHFDSAIISIPPETERNQPQLVKWLQSDRFFKLLQISGNLQVGNQFHALYTYATQLCHPTSTLHLCYPDRLVFALESQYRVQFLNDIRHLDYATTPVIFQRSQHAWQTHPSNYIQLESMVTELGELLFGRTLDFAWCHLVIKAQTLKVVLTQVTHPTIAMVAEIVLHLRDIIRTQEVDWLAWEDPHILGKDPTVLKAERESSRAEMQKRLDYVLPMLKLLYQTYIG